LLSLLATSSDHAALKKMRAMKHVPIKKTLPFFIHPSLIEVQDYLSHKGLNIFVPGITECRVVERSNFPICLKRSMSIKQGNDDLEDFWGDPDNHGN
jgi:hypothetical protein